MAKRFWMKFETAAWLNDGNLSSVSPAARGVWIDMLCVMWNQCDEVGVFIQAGRTCDETDIANQLRGDKDQTLATIGELLGARVLRRRDDGAYYSLKMVRDHAASQRRSKAAKARFGEQCSTDATPNAPQCSNYNSSSYIRCNPEIGNYKTLEDRCAQIYSAYPRKTAKQNGIKATMIALQSVPFDTLLGKVHAHATQTKFDGTEQKHIPLIATWMNQKRYEDDEGATGLWDGADD